MGKRQKCAPVIMPKEKTRFGDEAESMLGVLTRSTACPAANDALSRMRPEEEGWPQREVLWKGSLGDMVKSKQKRLYVPFVMQETDRCTQGADARLMSGKRRKLRRAQSLLARP